jgi:hypothetical protein
VNEEYDIFGSGSRCFEILFVREAGFVVSVAMVPPNMISIFMVRAVSY